ncbi:UNVERIFIED_CONTAM: hypothetical protein GTU68_056325 [Idotea baltica]|nr:hypothetical protein [Idotea baltica]
MKDSDLLRIIFLGDIVGRVGRNAFKQGIPDIIQEYSIDLVIINAENAAGGVGLNSKTAKELIDAGADLITLGDHTWKHKDLVNFLDQSEQCIRPGNYPDPAAGKGYTLYEFKGIKIGLMNLIGRVFIDAALDCPFKKADSFIDNNLNQADFVICDFHAEATSEKYAMAHYLDGKVSLLVGTHTHVQTADEQIFPGGMAYISDLGMTGVRQSVIGMDKDVALKRFLTGRPAAYKLAKGVPALSGVIVDISTTDFKAKSINRIYKELS